MTTPIDRAPRRTTFFVKDKKLGVVPLSYWCQVNGVKYNTIQARVWRAGLSCEATGFVTLNADKEHKELLRTPVMEKSHHE